MTAQGFLDIEDIDERAKYYENEVLDLKTFHDSFKALIAAANRQKYCYLITFTLHKKFHDTYDEAFIDEVTEYIIKQFQRKPLKIIEAHMVQELTKNNIPHWHVACSAEKFIAKNRFNYYAKKYGFIDISKSKCQTIDESLNYINKSGTSKDITHVGG